MRGLLVLVTLAGCTFEVGPIGTGPVEVPPDQPAGTSSVPPAADPPLFDPPSSALDAGSTPVPQSHSIVGDSCDKKKQCGAPLQCLTKTAFGTSIPGGYCSANCSSIACPSGSQCSNQWGALKLCLQTCPAAGCRPGCVCCTKSYNPGVCLPGFLCL